MATTLKKPLIPQKAKSRTRSEKKMFMIKPCHLSKRSYQQHKKCCPKFLSKKAKWTLTWLWMWGTNVSIILTKKVPLHPVIKYTLYQITFTYPLKKPYLYYVLEKKEHTWCQKNVTHGKIKLLSFTIVYILLNSSFILSLRYIFTKQI